MQIFNQMYFILIIIPIFDVKAHFCLGISSELYNFPISIKLLFKIFGQNTKHSWSS